MTGDRCAVTGGHKMTGALVTLTGGPLTGDRCTVTGGHILTGALDTSTGGPLTGDRCALYPGQRPVKRFHKSYQRLFDFDQQVA